MQQRKKEVTQLQLDRSAMAWGAMYFYYAVIAMAKSLL